MRKRNRGGRGNTWDERNEAIVLLRNTHGFTLDKLGRVFLLKKQTIAEIYNRDKVKFPSGVMHRMHR